MSIPTRAAAASFVYERMRNAVDYKEEHLIRRNAIERMLRRMLSQTAKREGIAENLVHELIHARYLPNNAIPQAKLVELEAIFEKYFALLGFASLKDVANRKSMPGFMLGILATEVDEFLVPPFVMHASINAMYEVLDRRIHIEDALEPDTRAKQIYIAASRAFYKNDDDTLAFHLFLLYYPHWRTADGALIREVGANLEAVRKKIQSDLAHPLKEKLAATVRKHVAYFVILRDIVTSDPEGSSKDLQSGPAFAERIAARCAENYRASRASLHRSIWRSIVYLVITKFLLFILLEIPVDYVLIRQFDVAPIVINLLFPPSLLAVIALSTKLPDEANTRLIVDGVNDVMRGRGDLIQVPKSRKRSVVLHLVFVLLYGALFALSFGLLISALQLLKFTAVSVLIFLFFLSLVSLFAYRIRLANQELIVTPPQRGILRGLWSFLTLPVLHAGKWMSQRFENINVFIFALDFVIEAPFKAFIKVIEDWMNYVYEKKEEI